MENGDLGVTPFKDNVVLESYRLKKNCIDMRVYDTSMNRVVIKELISNHNFVDILEDGTVIWKGRTDKRGYALISTKILPDRPEGDNGNKTIRLHRLLQQMFNNGAPVNAYVCHRDDNPLNITPSNLFQGTPGNNSLCIILHNRRIYPNGQDHWSCKIKDAEIVEMIHLHYANAMSITDLADKFNICPNYAGRIINGHVRTYISLKAIKAAIAARR